MFTVNYRTRGSRSWRVHHFETEAGALAALELYDRCGYECFIVRPALAQASA